MNNSCNMNHKKYGEYIKTPLIDIEKSIIKKYRKHLWAPFCKAVKEFDLIKEGDCLAICISGGKDSLLLAKIIQEYQKHGPIKFNVKYIAMDPGFNKINREFLEKNCEYLKIPVNIIDSNIFDVVEEIAKDYPCYMCAKMRRGFLYSKASELGCNKIVLGHHFNDVIETVLLNVLYAGNYMSMMPRIMATNYDNMELIRPLYFIEEERIITWSKYTNLPFMDCGCKVAAGKISSKRAEIKDLIKKLKQNFPNVDKSIFKSTYNVNINTVIGWVEDGTKHSFLERFNSEEKK
ncbi:MAG: tRNA 2-thiocytidine biosynthesis TtcA family protein [Bacilli bacterium]